MDSNRIRVPDFKKMKRRGEKITMLTAYDATMARLLDRAGVDALLVGDSLGMVVLGHDTTLPVTLDAMIHHTRGRQPRRRARARRRRHAVPDLSGHRRRGRPQRRPAAAGRRRRGGQARRRPARASTSSGAWSTSAFRSWATSACCRSRSTRWAATAKRGTAARSDSDAIARRRRRRSSRRARSPSCSSRFPSELAAHGDGASRHSRRSASAPDPIATARFSSATTCSASSTGSRRRSSSSTRSSAKTIVAATHGVRRRRRTPAATRSAPPRPCGAPHDLRCRAALIESIASLRDRLSGARRAGTTHRPGADDGRAARGHARLIEQARARVRLVAVSIFVNPLQFDRPDDLARYPRTLDADRALCDRLGVDVVFAPSVEEMYPSPPQCTVEVGRLADHLCGRYRPGHFRGVATVVMKLLRHRAAGPRVLRREGRAAARGHPAAGRRLERAGRRSSACRRCARPTAWRSARATARLSPEERQSATALYRALQSADRQIAGGVTDVRGRVKRAAAATIPDDPFAEARIPRDRRSRRHAAGRADRRARARGRRAVGRLDATDRQCAEHPAAAVPYSRSVRLSRTIICRPRADLPVALAVDDRRLAATMSAQQSRELERAHRRPRHQGRPLHADRAADRLHRGPRRGGRDGRRRRPRRRPGTRETDLLNPVNTRADGARHRPVRRQRVRSRRGVRA